LIGKSIKHQLSWKDDHDWHEMRYLLGSLWKTKRNFRHNNW